MNRENLPIDKDLLGRYLAGESCTQQELDIIKQYFANDAYGIAIQQVMEAEWAYLRSVNTSNTQADENYERFLNTRLHPYNQRQKKLIALFRESMKYAAIAIFLAGITMIYLLNKGTGEQTAAIQWIEKYAPRGQRHKLTMPDSSIVYLAPDSRVWYPDPKQYASGNRTVRLEGEAYFEVKHDDAHPFTVVTGVLKTIDVGTAFNIRAYTDEQHMAVAVAEGEVQVTKTGPDQKTISKNLIASQGIVFDNKLQQWHQVLIDANMIGSWRKGIFEYDRKPLENVVAAIARHYNLQFAWQDASLKNKIITIQFHGDQQATALKLLELTAGIRLRKKDNIIWISKK